MGFTPYLTHPSPASPSEKRKEALKVKGDRKSKANPLYASEDYVKSGDIPTAVSLE